MKTFDRLVRKNLTALPVKVGMMIPAVLFFLVIAIFSTEAHAAWLTGWNFRRPVTLSNPGSALTNYQIRVNVTYDSGMNSDFSDLRFTTDDETTEIDYWIEQYSPSTSAIVWVEVPAVAATPTDTTIYMYYGNTTATTTSNGSNTFVFFDDFSTWSGWTNYRGGNVVQDTTTFSGLQTLRKTSNNDPAGGWKSLGSTISNFRMLARDHRRRREPEPRCKSSRHVSPDGRWEIRMVRHGAGA